MKYSVEREYQYFLNFIKHSKMTTEYIIKKMIEKKALSNMSANDSNEKKDTLNSLIQELHNLIGLQNVKTLIEEIQAFVHIQNKRKEVHLNTDALVLHMIFKGNPGTGKTTVARLLGKIFHEMGILEIGHLIELERADLVGEYIGHTAVKVKEHIKKSIGGIMFIDEAYSLARGGKKDFGKEAIDALVKGMEDYKENFILILAGYCKEMDEFLQTNPGLKSRFPIHLNFPDYTLEELLDIAEIMLKNKQYQLSISAKSKLAKIISHKRMEDRVNSGNARLVRNLIEKSIRRQAVRLKNCSNSILSKQDLLTLKREDIEEIEDSYNLHSN